ncbi:pentapeptide repeat-containing protein [Millisia brevis]|uniref:pentapeptide repeat-containing protein n=1 Tax=Millisia brevis TaxID=264148 RepID=UPI0034E1F24E
MPEVGPVTKATGLLSVVGGTSTSLSVPRDHELAGSPFAGIRALGRGHPGPCRQVGAAVDTRSRTVRRAVPATVVRAFRGPRGRRPPALLGAAFHGWALDGRPLERGTFDPTALDPTALDRSPLERAALHRATFHRATFHRATFHRATLERTALDGSRFRQRTASERAGPERPIAAAFHQTGRPQGERRVRRACGLARARRRRQHTQQPGQPGNRLDRGIPLLGVGLVGDGPEGPGPLAPQQIDKGRNRVDERRHPVVTDAASDIRVGRVDHPIAEPAQQRQPIRPRRRAVGRTQVDVDIRSLWATDRHQGGRVVDVEQDEPLTATPTAHDVATRQEPQLRHRRPGPAAGKVLVVVGVLVAACLRPLGALGSGHIAPSPIDDDQRGRSRRTDHRQGEPKYRHQPTAISLLDLPPAGV